MDDVLVLEDGELSIGFIMGKKPKNLEIKLVENSEKFREYITNGGEAKLYFLDDKVPERQGAAIEPNFINNCSFLFEHKPSARVFYTGSFIKEKAEIFCRKYNIELVDKGDIWKVVQRESPK